MPVAGVPRDVGLSTHCLRTGSWAYQTGTLPYSSTGSTVTYSYYFPSVPENTLFKWKHQGQCCGSGFASKSKDSGAAEAQNGAMEAGGPCILTVEMGRLKNGAEVDLWNRFSLLWWGAGSGSPLKWKVGSGSAKNVKNDILEPHLCVSDSGSWIGI